MDCNDCNFKQPDLFPENRMAWELWLKVQNQYRTSGPVILGLDFVAVKIIADIHGIRLTPGIFEKLKAMERWAFDPERRVK